MADWMNQLHAAAEESTHFVPVQVTSNSSNENGEVAFSMNDAADLANAVDVHSKSVVLLKNDGCLPLAEGKKVYAALTPIPLRYWTS